MPICFDVYEDGSELLPLLVRRKCAAVVIFRKTLPAFMDWDYVHTNTCSQCNLSLEFVYFGITPKLLNYMHSCCIQDMQLSCFLQFWH